MVSAAPEDDCYCVSKPNPKVESLKLPDEMTEED